MMRRLAVALLLALVSHAAEAQTVVGARFQLSTGPCTLRSGSGAPSTSLGVVCDTYYRTDSPYTVYVKTGASTWTPAALMPASATAGDVVTATGAASTGRVAGVAVGQVLASGGVSTPPAYTSTPSLTGITGAANLTINPVGDIVFDPTGNDLLPTTGYDLNIGALTNKFLTLHAAELWVETLVAQDTMATIGGRVLVGPTTTLTADLASGGTTMQVKHNQIANGDRVVLQVNGAIEWIAVTSGSSGSAGAYLYSITRNLDGSGANNWASGDAVFNTGTTGDGYIDLYSVNGLRPGTTVGPTIVMNARTGTTYSDIEPRAAFGNLNGLYGYSADTYGLGLGDTNNAWVKIDPTNGVRIGENATTYFSVDPAGNALFAGRLTIGTGRNWLSNTEFLRGRGTGDIYRNYWGGSSTTTTVDPSASYTCAAAACYQRASNGSGWSWLAVDENTAATSVTVGANAPGNTPLGGGTVDWYPVGVTPANTTYSRIGGPVVPIDEDVLYEFSFYVGMYPSAYSTSAYITWYGVDGGDAGDQPDYISEQSMGTACVTGTQGPDIGTWCRAGGIVDPPAGSRLAHLQVISVYDGGEFQPITFITRPYFGEAATGQTTLTPWGPGGQSLITGDMLSTDLVMANTIRSAGATALSTGTGFWLDATSTPTFRVGDPSGNYLKWDGTDLTSTSANFTFDASGVRIAPTDSATFLSTRAYGWTVPTGDLGISGLDGSTNGRQLLARSRWTGTGDRSEVINLSTEYAGSVGGAQTATFSLAASNGTSIASTTATTITLTGEIYPSGVTGDGTGKVLCIKADTSVGTCDATTIGASTCTCS